jgi:hypothetical protein
VTVKRLDGPQEPDEPLGTEPLTREQLIKIAWDTFEAEAEHPTAKADLLYLLARLRECEQVRNEALAARNVFLSCLREVEAERDSLANAMREENEQARNRNWERHWRECAEKAEARVAALEEAGRNLMAAHFSRDSQVWTVQERKFAEALKVGTL